MKAMIFAAGLGTRLKPFTDSHPKALARVNNKTLLERNIEYLKTFGIKEIVINIHHFPDQITAYLKSNNYFNCNINISDETDALLETGGGLKKAACMLKGSEPFLVMNVDILTNLNIGKMIAFHKRNNALVTLAVTSRITSRYFLFNENDELCGWKNIKTGETIVKRNDKELISKAFSGIHIIDPGIFDYLNQDGKFSIVEAYLDLCESNRILGYDHSHDLLIDVGKPDAVEKAEELFQ